MNEARWLIRPRFLIGVLLAGAVAVWLLRPAPAKRTNRGPVVGQIVNNLSLIQQAKELWAHDHGRTGAVMVTEQDLAPYVHDFPDCLRHVVGERYKLNSLSESPEAELTRKWGSCPKGTRFRLSPTNMHDYQVILPNKPHAANSRHDRQWWFGGRGMAAVADAGRWVSVDALMKFVFLLAPLLMMAGCGQRDAALRQKIAGTWELTNGHGVITIASDGSMFSRFTGSTQSWTYEGTWQLRDDQIVITTTKSNSMPCRDVASARIIRADGHELVYDLSGQTISLSRK